MEHNDVLLYPCSFSFFLSHSVIRSLKLWQFYTNNNQVVKKNVCIMQNLTYSLETSVPVFQLDFFKQLANCEWENIMNNFTWHDHIHRSYMVYFITVSEDLNIYTCLFQFQRACNYLLCGLCACLIFFITILSYSSLVFTVPLNLVWCVILLLCTVLLERLCQAAGVS